VDGTNSEQVTGTGSGKDASGCHPDAISMDNKRLPIRVDVDPDASMDIHGCWRLLCHLWEVSKASCNTAGWMYINKNQVVQIHIDEKIKIFIQVLSLISVFEPPHSQRMMNPRCDALLQVDGPYDAR